MEKVPTDRWDDVRARFEGALEQPPESRAAWLSAHCDDDVVRDEVASLLACHAQPHQVFDHTSAAFSLPVPPEDHALPADHRIGAYRIERLLGRGGMGAVYLATRSDDSFDRQVAIKVISQSLDGAGAVRRFVAERQTLAGLDHPNIARLLDGGATDDRLPYFVMEYVDGEPIHEYCEHHHLGLTERLQLFLAVAAAVQHAHEHLVVHRDLKPDNILVRADGQPKLLDFGIAKVLSPADAGPMTTINAPAMTPRYASPEQVSGGPIGTPSDIYSLGVLLYELLTGRLPHGEDTDSGWQVARAISEIAPAAPSVAARGGTAKAWAHRLPGDLDAIVLMALRKEPERRYRTVDQFAEDVRRYLDNRPVLARPDTLSYRARKFVSRNRLASAAAVVAVLALTTGVVAATWQASVARRSAARAQAETARAQRVSEFLKTVIALPDPSWNAAGAGGRNDMTVLDLLKNAGDRIDRELGSDPEMAADLHHAIGNTYRARGLYNDAQPHFARALELRQKVLPSNDPKVADSLFYFGANQFWLGHLEVAEQYYERAIAIERTLPLSQAGQLPYMLLDLGTMPSYAKDSVKHEAAITEARDLLIRQLGPAHIAVGFAFQRLGMIRTERGDYGEAKRLLAQSLQILEKGGASPLDRGAVEEELAIVLEHEGDFTEAARLHRRVMAARLAAYGKGTAVTIESQNQLASALIRLRQFPEALSLATEVIDALRRQPMNVSAPLVTALMNKAWILELTHAGGADPVVAEAIRIVDRQPVPQRCGTGKMRKGIVDYFEAANRHADAARMFAIAWADIDAACSHDSADYREMAKAAPASQHPASSR